MTGVYTWLARYYDRLMDHVSYEEWAGYIRRVMREWGQEPRTVLELGAGTCRLAPLLDFPGCPTIICSDLSLQMLCRGTADIPKIVCDAARIPVREGWADLVLMCYDALNYLSPDQVPRAFGEIRRVLASQGIFFFDVTTEHNSRTWFDPYDEVIELPEGLLARNSWFEQGSSRQHNRFNLFLRDGDSGLYRRYEEHHIQYIYDQEWIRAWLMENGFAIGAALDSFSMRVAHEQSDRIHFVAVAR